VEETLARLFKLVGRDGFNKGLSDAEIDRLWATTALPLPDEYRQMLRIFDGQSHDATLTFPPSLLSFLSLERAVAVWQYLKEFEDEPCDDLVDEGRVRNMVYHPCRFPIAQYEVAGRNLFLDFIPGERGREGQVIFNPSETPFFAIAETLTQLFADYVRLLESGRAKITDEDELRRFVTASGEPLTFERYMQLVKG
jgi:cell wall assembly regulator SMI1